MSQTRYYHLRKINKRFKEDEKENRHIPDSLGNQFQIQCYQVIKEQQQHIQKLQKALERKDTIINNFLNKAKGNNRQNAYLHNLPDNQHNFKLEIDKLHHQIQYLSHENQCLRIQLSEKQREIQKIYQDVYEKERMLDEDQEIVEGLKKAYEAKIAKILNDVKNKIQFDVKESMQKTKNTENEGYTTVTPIKSISKQIMTEQESTKAKQSYVRSGEKMGNFTNSNNKRYLVNSPYLEKRMVKNLQFKIQKFRAQTQESQCSFKQQYTVRQPEQNIRQQWNMGQSLQKKPKIQIRELLQRLGGKLQKFQGDIEQKYDI